MFFGNVKSQARPFHVPVGECAWELGVGSELGCGDEQIGWFSWLMLGPAAVRKSQGL